jgi:hypothetical protein
MNYEMKENGLSINFGFSREHVPYDTVRNVQIQPLTLVLRLFGASWPGLHWGYYQTNNVGRVKVYATKMTGQFAVIELVDSKRIAVTPEDPERFVGALWEKLKSPENVSQETKYQSQETKSKAFVYAQILVPALAYIALLSYFLSIYPSLPETLPMHFDFNWNPNRWGHKSELLAIMGVAGMFPAINGILALKFRGYDRIFSVFFTIIMLAAVTLFFGVLTIIMGSV